jgi:methyl-accepting chemotaxis protein
MNLSEPYSESSIANTITGASMTAAPPTQAETLSWRSRTQIQQRRQRSLGVRLFVAVMGGAIAGLGATAFLFYRTLEQQAKEEIQITLENRVNEIDSQLGQGEQFLKSMANAAQFLHTNQVGSPEAYKRLVISLMEVRPKLVTGFGVLQTPRGLVTNRKWFGPYIVEYTAETVDLVKKGIAERLPSPHTAFAYEDIASADEYFKQDYYTEPVKIGKNYWVEPYMTEGFSVPLTTFAGPIKDAQGKLIAIFNGDIALQDLVDRFKNQPVFQKTGYFVLVTGKGNILAYPPDPKKATGSEAATSIPELNTIWSQVQQELPKKQAGIFLSSATASYWAYQTIPRTNWIMLAKVPYSAVTGSAVWIASSGGLLAAVILAGVVVLFIRRLNQRLQPILDECNQLAATDAEIQAVMQQQDEIGQLSTSFFNLIHQLSENEIQLKQEITRTREVQLQAEQQATQLEAESLNLQTDVEDLLNTVSAVEDGNLTVQAPVSDRVTGLVADTFNRLVEELANIMTQVSATTQQVTQRSQQLNESASTVAQNTQQQAHEVGRVLNLSEQVQRSAQDSATQIELTNQSLVQVRATIEQGQLAINRLTQGIQTLQAGAGQIMKRTTDLDEFVSVTDQFVQEQSQVAELIQSLAMSATLLSARATAQQDPRQMMVVAKEFETIANQIKSLAEQTNRNLSVLQKRTDLIQTTVSSLTQDLQNIDGLVGGFTQGVEKSSQAFGSIQSATADVVKTGQAISQSNQQIVQISQDTAIAMRSMAQLAGKTAQLTQRTRSESEQMGQVAEQLQQRVQFFRLPTPLPQAQSSQPESSHTSP